MKFAIKPLIAAAAMASMLGGAQAATFTSIGLAGSGTAYTLVAPIIPPLTGTAGAILSTLTLAPGYSLLYQPAVSTTDTFTFCVELYQALSTPGTPITTYTVVDPAGTGYTGLGANGWGPAAATISGRIDQLMTYALPFTNAANAAALQFAIWEVIYEATPLSVIAGTGFRLSGGPTPITMLADSFLLNFASVPASRHYSVLTDRDFQDVLIQVPEPMSASLVLLGLLGASAARRRKPT